MTRAEASRLSFDELLLAGVRECGERLDRHPMPARTRALRSWMAEREGRRNMAPEAVERITASVRSNGWSRGSTPTAAAGAGAPR